MFCNEYMYLFSNKFVILYGNILLKKAKSATALQLIWNYVCAVFLISSTSIQNKMGFSSKNKTIKSNYLLEVFFSNLAIYRMYYILKPKMIIL